MNRNVLLVAGLALALAIPAWGIVQKERLIADGDVVLLELAPVDPRSLIQGDYMRLEYVITRDLRERRAWPRDGHIVVRVAPDRVATFARLHDGRPLASGELLLRYRRRGGAVRVGSGAFLFEEGTARRFEGARYGELRVAHDGATVLVGLRDSLANPIK